MKISSLYILGLLLLSSLGACTDHVQEKEQQTDTVPEDSLSLWALSLLETDQNALDSSAHLLYIASLPKLSVDSQSLLQLQVQAIDNGRKKALQKVYNRIATPSKIEHTKHLDLSYQNIHYIPNKVTQYPNLRYLSLKNNRIQAINPKLRHCEKLRKLDLSSNGIKTIPFGLIYLTQLEELVLTDNLLKGLPSYFFNLRQLRSVDISNLHSGMAEFGNNIQHVPSVLLKMPKIEKLFLEKLPLRQLPNQLKQMSGLKVLSLNGNRAMNLSQAFQVLSQVPNLVALDLSFIGRRTLPRSIEKLQHLKVLIWHEERKVNQDYIRNTLQQLLPNTKIYFGEAGVATPFLRGNSIKTIERAGY